MVALNHWYEKAGVRKAPRRTLQGGTDGVKLFPSTLIPYLQHERLVQLPPPEIDGLIARHLYQYLTFTAHFETRVVNRATERIANSRCGFEVPAETQLDAYKIYCDEAYHALYSRDVVNQIAAATRIPAVDHDFDNFLCQLDIVGSEVLPDEPVLVQLLQVVVFETLVTVILNDVPRDRTILPLVRDIVRDHAIDEARHHGYFSGLFRQMWATLGSELRCRTARCLPRLIVRSLWPHLRPVRESLLRAGLNVEEVYEVITDTYPEEKVRANIRETARYTLRLLESTGVFDVPGGRSAFEDEGLI